MCALNGYKQTELLSGISLLLSGLLGSLLGSDLSLASLGVSLDNLILNLVLASLELGTGNDLQRARDLGSLGTVGRLGLDNNILVVESVVDLNLGAIEIGLVDLSGSPLVGGAVELAGGILDVLLKRDGSNLGGITLSIDKESLRNNISGSSGGSSRVSSVHENVDRGDGGELSGSRNSDLLALDIVDEVTSNVDVLSLQSEEQDIYIM
jgi:hypothetical protein